MPLGRDLGVLRETTLDRKECNWVATDVKNDRCTTCGKGYTYS